MEDGNAVVVSDSRKIKVTRRALEAAGYYDNTRKIGKAAANSFALPISHAGAEHLSMFLRQHDCLPELFSSDCILAKVDLKKSKKETLKGEHEILRDTVSNLLSKGSLTEEENAQLLAELPKSWERHGDLVVLPANSFRSPRWKEFGEHLWNLVAEAMRCKRLALDGRVACGGLRTSNTELVLGDDSWVEHIDKGVKYVFDVTKCMFSSSNITEKLRVASMDCIGETIVDLYAGIGYFTLPYLVHAGAKLVHACEWNPHAVEGLRKGLEANKVAERCVIHFGDNKQVAPRGVADRVNLGLIPSSERGWPVACAALRSNTGGWMHIHGNVSSKPGCPHLAESNPWDENPRESLVGVLQSVRHTDVGSKTVHLSSHSSDLNQVDVQQSGFRDAATELSTSQLQTATSLTCGQTPASLTELKHPRADGNVNPQHPSASLYKSDVCTDPLNTGSTHPQDTCDSQRFSSDQLSTPKAFQRSKELPKMEIWRQWAQFVAARITELFIEMNPLPCDKWWNVRVHHIEHVKSYAPHVDHLVVDVECRPQPISSD